MTIGSGGRYEAKPQRFRRGTVTELMQGFLVLSALALGVMVALGWGKGGHR